MWKYKNFLQWLSRIVLTLKKRCHKDKKKISELDLIKVQESLLISDEKKKEQRGEFFWQNLRLWKFSLARYFLWGFFEHQSISNESKFLEGFLPEVQNCTEKSNNFSFTDSIFDRKIYCNKLSLWRRIFYYFFFLFKVFKAIVKTSNIQNHPLRNNPHSQ